MGHNWGIAGNTQTTDVPTGVNLRTDREWKVENTGSVGAVNLKFDGYDDSWMLYTDADGDFTSGAISQGTLSAVGEITSVTLADNSYFMLAKMIAAPWGIAPNLELWLKANDNGGVTTDGMPISVWTDESGSMNDASNTAGDGQTEPTYSTTNTINFNPTVEFNGTTSGLDLGSNYIFSDSVNTDWLSIYSVVLPTSNSTSIRYVSDFGEAATGGYGISYAGNRYGYYTSGDFGWNPTFSQSHTNGLSPVIIEMNADFGTEANYVINGEQVNNTSVASSLTSNEINEAIDRSGIVNGPFTIGRQSKALTGPRAFEWAIAELIVYTDDKQVEANQVQSYLALKYGITLDASIGSYVNSTRSWVYDLSSGYANDVVGIANDIDSSLDQERIHHLVTVNIW